MIAQQLLKIFCNLNCSSWCFAWWLRPLQWAWSWHRRINYQLLNLGLKFMTHIFELVELLIKVRNMHLSGASSIVRLAGHQRLQKTNSLLECSLLLRIHKISKISNYIWSLRNLIIFSNLLLNGFLTCVVFHHLQRVHRKLFFKIFIEFNLFRHSFCWFYIIKSIYFFCVFASYLLFFYLGIFLNFFYFFYRLKSYLPLLDHFCLCLLINYRGRTYRLTNLSPFIFFT